MLTCLRDWLKTAYHLLCLGILLWLWGAVFMQFLGIMLPRLDHLGLAGMSVNDRPCGSPQCDFSGFWAAGLLARAGQFSVLFDPQAFLGFLHRIFSPDAEMIRWYYPPVALLPVAVISFLPFELAFWVWNICFLAASVWLLRKAGLVWPVVAMVLMSPAALWNLELGQFGIIMGSCLIFGLFCLAREKWQGGAVLGILLCKPQYALLTPVAMFACRSWRFMLACALVVGVLLLCSAGLFGLQVWHIYLTRGLRVSHEVLQLAFNGHNSEKFGVSVFWMVRSFGGGLSLSYWLQACCSLAALLGTWLTWRHHGLAAEARVGVTVILSLLATPYGYTDDMVAWSAVLALSAWRRNWRLGGLDVLFWIWPMLCPVISERTGLLFTPVIVLLSLWRVTRRPGASPEFSLIRGHA
ncbi:glycosyltransferase family 87 protein [Acidocella sp.]|uniref:glycosyltransferase family 87 protein n=1 Tax=Acidocella sp. TaxID=50710 RepID=UPI003D0567EA